MIAEGYTGRKGKGGFYRMQQARAAAAVKEAIDLATGEYRPEHKADLPEVKAAGHDLRALLTAPGRVGAYAFRVLASTLPMPRRWCRRSPTPSSPSMRRCSSATTGNAGRSS